MNEIWGSIHIHDGGWEVELPGQKNGNVNQLESELRYINKVNPRFGQSICRHVRFADRCEMYIGDDKKMARCLFSHYNMNK